MPAVRLPRPALLCPSWEARKPFGQMTCVFGEGQVRVIGKSERHPKSAILAFVPHIIDFPLSRLDYQNSW